MKRRTFCQRKTAPICAGGGFLLAVSVLSSIALGFSTYLIGSPLAEAGPISANVGSIVYSRTINFSDIGLDLQGETLDSPSFAVVPSTSSNSLSGSPTFEVSGKIDHSKIGALDFYDELFLKISFFLEGTSALNYNFVKTMAVSLSNYSVYSFEYEGARTVSTRGATTDFLVPVKAKSDRSLWTLTELDAVNSFNQYSQVLFSFFIDPQSLSEESLSVSKYSITFSLVKESL